MYDASYASYVLRLHAHLNASLDAGVEGRLLLERACLLMHMGPVEPESSDEAEVIYVDPLTYLLLLMACAYDDTTDEPLYPPSSWLPSSPSSEPEIVTS